MLINEVSKRTKLTKKAIEYYTLQGLIYPTVLENGYRDYSSKDIDNLTKISVLRKLDISIEDIRNILNDTTNTELKLLSVKKELNHKRDMLKKSIFQELSEGKPYEEIEIKLQSVENSKTITDKLLDAFPGYYGRFVCMHFARFLNEPIQSEVQQSAYETILLFLDNMPALEIPKDLEDYLIEGTSHLGIKQIENMLENTKASYENPDEFLINNKEAIEIYLKFKQSEEYKNSPACKLMELMRAFNSSSGYNDIFIPAIKQISSSYAEYYRHMEIANEKFLEKYPEIEK